VMIVVMIESPEGVAMVDKIAAVPGIDVVFAASGDIGSFTGWERTDPRYMKLIKRVHDETLKAGKILGGPFSWSDRPDFMFLQGPSETSLIETGAEVELTGAAAGKNEDVATGDR